MDNYLLFVYNHHHGVAYIENLNKVEVQVDEVTKVQLQDLYLVKDIIPATVDSVARSVALHIFQTKEGGFDRYYKVVRISRLGYMYDITKDTEEKTVIELTTS